MSEGALSYLAPEAQARVRIDAMLTAAGWAVQDYGAVNLAAARGVAVREFVLGPIPVGWRGWRGEPSWRR